MIKNIFRRGTFAFNVAILSSGGGVGQLVVVIATPFLTRLYAPEAFGTLALMISVYVIVANLVTLRYEMTIPLISDDKDSLNMVVLNFSVAVFLLLMFLCVLFFCRSAIVGKLGLEKLGWMVFLLPVMAFLEAGRNIVRYWFIRMERFGTISLGVVLRNSSTVVVQLFMSVCKLTGAVGLILGHLSGQVTNFIWLWGNFRRGLKNKITDSVSIERILYNAKKYKNFPLFASWNVVLNSFSVHLPVVLLSLFYPREQIGQYAVSVRILSTPLNLLGMSVSQVYYRQISKYLRNGIPVFPFMMTVAFKLLGIILIPLMIVLFFGEPLFSFVLGEKWSISGKIAGLLVPLYLTRFVVTPVSNIFAAVGKQYISLMWQAVYVGVVFSCFYFLGKSGDMFATLRVYSWVVSGLYILLFILSSVVSFFSIGIGREK